GRTGGGGRDPGLERCRGDLAAHTGRHHAGPHQRSADRAHDPGRRGHHQRGQLHRRPRRAGRRDRRHRGGGLLRLLLHAHPPAWPAGPGGAPAGLPRPGRYLPRVPAAPPPPRPAPIVMGDTGARLIGLLLAYAPIPSLASLDPGSLTDPRALSLGTVNRFGAILPLLLPAAILLIPYTDLLLAVFRRARAGMSPFAPDRKHLHHRMLDIGHSHRT